MFRLASLAVAIVAVLRPALCIPQAEAAAAAPSVTIKNGVVIGAATKLSGATAAATKYVGIPYASSPPLRFAPPQAAASWTTPLRATATKPACIQQFNYPQEMRDTTRKLFNNPGKTPPAESEDCLYVNVYVPPGTKASDKKAVLFWIFGGNLQFGTGGLDFYDGTSFATNQDVIVVTHNYRTNVFGFPGAPQIKAPNQNPGYLDQRFALQWVANNIAGFGGDPSKVTIFGESAGGYSVRELIALPPKPMTFRAAIMESEAALNQGRDWKQLVFALGCQKTPNWLKCVRSKPARLIKDTIEQNMFAFFPAEDGVTHTEDARTQVNSGRAAKVPFMIGTNTEEGRPFLYILGLGPNNSTNEILERIFPGDTGAQGQLVNLLGGTVTYETLAEALTQVKFLCPASELAQLGQSKGASVWRYLFSASFPNLQILPDLGAWHSSEIPSVYGTYDRENAIGKATQQQIKLSAFMQKTWANFAKAPALGPREGWPRLGAGNVFNLGADGSSGGKTVAAAMTDRQCVLLKPVVDSMGL